MDIEITTNTDEAILLANIEINSRRPLPWVTQEEANEEHAVIVGGGPSLIDCLPLIRWRQSLGQKVFALNNTAKLLEANGITVDYQVIVDARPHNVRFLGNAGTYLLSSQCDEALFDAADPAKTILWHPVMEMPENHINAEKEYAMVGGGTTVGLSAMCLAYTLGFRHLHLFGYDSSHRFDRSHAYAQPENWKEPIVQVTAYGQTWDCSLAMAYQAELFPEVANSLIELGCIITMDGDGLLPTAFRHLWADTTIDERSKYEQMWNLPQYRKVAPGEYCVDAFLSIANVQTNEVVIDFGCGTGRAALAIKEKTGCDVLMLDFTNNSLDAAVKEKIGGGFLFAQTDLTKFTPHMAAHHGFCTDVMEHIPPEDVDTVLKNIMAGAEKVFFQISFVPDHCGALIGHSLHLSVYPYNWWLKKFEDLGFVVQWSQDEEDAGLFYVIH